MAYASLLREASRTFDALSTSGDACIKRVPLSTRFMDVITLRRRLSSPHSHSETAILSAVKSHLLLDALSAVVSDCSLAMSDLQRVNAA